MNSTKGNKKKIFQADGTNHKSVNTSAIRPISPLDQLLNNEDDQENNLKQHQVNRPFKIKEEASMMFLDLDGLANEIIQEVEEENIQQYLINAPLILKNIIQNIEEAVKESNLNKSEIDNREDSNDTDEINPLEERQIVKSTDNYGSSNARGTIENEINHTRHQGDIKQQNLKERVALIQTFLRNKIKRGQLLKAIEEDYNNLVEHTIMRGNRPKNIEQQPFPIQLTRSVGNLTSLNSLREYWANDAKFSISQNCNSVKAFCRITDIILIYKYNQKESQANHKAEDFRRISNLGKGRFGVVDLYEYKNLGIPVAVKQLKSKDNFTREVFLMESINSAYKPKLFYFSEKDMQIYMETGLCSLEELRHHFYETGKKLTDRQAFSILMQVILAVEVLIQQQSFHSDIKPSNIVFRVSTSEKHNNPELSVLLIDYGGSSFEIEDYWTFFTPAFVCSPLMYRLSCNKCWEISNEAKETVSVRNDKIPQKEVTNKDNMISEYPQSDNSKGLVINSVYSTESNKLLTSVEMNAHNSKIISKSKQDPSIDSSASSFPKSKFDLPTQDSTEEMQPIASCSYENINNQLSQQYLSSQNHSSQAKQNFLLGRAVPGNILKARSDGFDIDQILEKRDFSKDNNFYNTEWLKTLNVKFSKDSEENLQDDWLSWEEIRYAEVYASCRSVQFLLLTQSDYQAGMFNKNQTQSFIDHYKEQYPQTLSVIERISRNKQLKLSKNDIKLLCFGLEQSDLAIDLEPNLAFQISSLKEGIP